MASTLERLVILRSVFLVCRNYKLSKGLGLELWLGLGLGVGLGAGLDASLLLIANFRCTMPEDRSPVIGPRYTTVKKTSSTNRASSHV